MIRSLIIALALASPAVAQTLEDALRLQENPPPGMSQDDALDRAYEMMAAVFQKDPTKWQALLHRGINRCDKMLLARQTLRARLLAMRAAGESEKEIERIEGLGNEFIQDLILRDARANFGHMERVMTKLGEPREDLILFANAMMKFSNGEYLNAHEGAPGAIDDLKKLIQRKWMPRFCAERIALAYMDLGASAFAEREFDLAQEYWDKGLRFAQTERVRRFLMTNKAGGYEMDDEFGLAEKLLREQLRKEPDRISHWKNLGLVLGYQNRLRPALYAYRQARRLCGEYGARSSMARLHGNAWLKAAMIHGKLLEAEGDVKLAWKLFLEYRAMFGDDYNFGFNFGEFAFHMGQYDLAYKYMERAVNLQPYCPHARELLQRIVQRVTFGTPEERKVLRAKVKAELEESRQRFSLRHETPQMKRVCGGLQDLGDGDLRRAPLPPMDPDPLAGYRVDSPPPPWITKRAAERDPFVPYDVSVEEFLAETAEEAELHAKRAQDAAPVDAGQKGVLPEGSWKFLAGGAAGLAGVLAVVAMLRRKSA